MINHSLMDVVIKLHDTARLIEKTLGQCTLSKSIRQEADHISDLVKSIKLSDCA